MKRVLISLLIFIIVCVTVTGLMIYEKRSNSDTQNPNRGDTYEDSINNPAKVELTGFYDENSIEIDEINYESGDITGEYIQISGLKDKQVETKINERLKNEILDYANGLLANEKIHDISISQAVEANFGNVLSAYSYVGYYTGKISEFGVEEYNSYNAYINLKLTDGNDIEFKDIFMNDTDVVAIVSKEIYENLAWENKFSNEGAIDDYETYWKQPVTEINETSLRNRVAKFKEKNENGDLDFMLRAEGVTVWLDENNVVSIDFEDYVDDVAIYTRFLTDDSIYENNDLGKVGIFNFSSLFDENIYQEFGQVSDNLFVDIGVCNYTEDSLKTDILLGVENQIKEEAKSHFDSEFAKANSEKDKKVFYNEQYTISADRIIQVVNSKQRYEMSSEFFDDIFINVLAKSYRHSRDGGGAYGETIYINTEDISGDVIEDHEYDDQRCFSAKTGKELKEIKDFFIDGYDYDSIFRDVFLKQFFLRKEGKLLSDEELQSEYEKTEIKFDYYNYEFEVYNERLGYNTSEYDENYRWTEYSINLNELNPDYLTV